MSATTGLKWAFSLHKLFAFKEYYDLWGQNTLEAFQQLHKHSIHGILQLILLPQCGKQRWILSAVVQHSYCNSHETEIHKFILPTQFLGFSKCMCVEMCLHISKTEPHWVDQHRNLQKKVLGKKNRF